MSDAIRRRAIVSGRVQGVGFRWSTAQSAERLGLAGWARNLADGTVEVEAEGSPSAVAELLAWLGHGPDGAAVSGVETVEIEPTGQRGFVPR